MFYSKVCLTVLIYVCSLDIGTPWIQVNKQNDDAARDLERFEVYSEGNSAAFAEVISGVNAF